MRIPKIDPKKLFRVCNPCGKELKSTRVYGRNRYHDPDEEDEDNNNSNNNNNNTNNEEVQGGESLC